MRKSHLAHTLVECMEISEEKRKRRSVSTLPVMPHVMLLVMPTAPFFVGFLGVSQRTKGKGELPSAELCE